MSTLKSGAVRPTGETGSARVLRRLGHRQRERDVLRELRLRSAVSLSGKLKPLSQSSGSNASSGSSALAVWQVDISGVKASVP